MHTENTAKEELSFDGNTIGLHPQTQKFIRKTFTCSIHVYTVFIRLYM